MAALCDNRDHNKDSIKFMDLEQIPNKVIYIYY